MGLFRMGFFFKFYELVILIFLVSGIFLTILRARAIMYTRYLTMAVNLNDKFHHPGLS